MSSAGDKVAAVAELGLWVAAAALIASAAGMRLPGGVLAGPTATAGAAAVASGTPGPSSTATPTPTLAPTPSAAPTLSPLVRKLQTYLARKDFQFAATGTGSMSATEPNQSVDLALAGSMSYRSGDEYNVTKMTSNGRTITADSIYVGSNKYERSDGGPWIKKPRTPTDSPILFSPSRLFVDTGVETKNGTALHRLETADPAALSAEFDALGIVTNAHVMLVFWTGPDGNPAAFRMEGTWDEQITGVTAHVTMAEEYAITKLAGVTISAPKNPWQWIVDGTDGIAFGLPPNWTKDGTNKTLGLTSYVSPPGQIGYESWAVGAVKLDAFADSVVSELADPVENRRSATVGGVPAVTFGLHRSKQRDYESVTLLLNNGRAYEFLSFGAAGKDAATDAMAAQVLATLEFTK